jgi:predicted metal-dependent peptidase
MDAVINRILEKDNNFKMDELPKGSVRTVKGNNGIKGISIGIGQMKREFNIPNFENKDWVPIYWDIYNQMEKECSSSGSGLNCDSNSKSDKNSGKGSSSSDNRKSIAEKMKELAKQIAESNPMNGDAGKQKDETLSPEQEQQAARFRQKVISAVETCKEMGTVPGEVTRLVDELESGKVVWTSHLRRLIKTEISRDDFSQRPNPRRAHISFGGRRQPPIFPKIESEALGDVFLALDTSGSMGQEDIRQGLSEFAGLRQTTPFNLYFVSCDAKAYEVTSYTKDEDPDWLNIPIDGGGGTDFRPVFNLIQQYKKEKGVRPALLVYFTDTIGSFPDQEPEYPVIWVSNYKGGNAPFGTYLCTVD